MNGVSHTAVKVKKARAASAAGQGGARQKGRRVPVDDVDQVEQAGNGEMADDFETIEQAVMATPRGRWFLAEYLRRRQSAELQRLLEAVERLQRIAPGAAVVEPSAAAPEGLRLLLAQAADELAHGLGEAAEPTLPEAAAGRLAHLLKDVRQRAGQGEAQPLLELLTDVLHDMLVRLADMLGEPMPRAGEASQVAQEVAGGAAMRVAAVAEAAAPAESPGKMFDETPAGAVAPGGETAPRGGAANASAPAAVSAPSRPAGQAKGQKRIVIHRHGRSGEIDIPLPERDDESSGRTVNDTMDEEKPGGREKPKVRIR